MKRVCISRIADMILASSNDPTAKHDTGLRREKERQPLSASHSATPKLGQSTLLEDARYTRNYQYAHI